MMKVNLERTSATIALPRINLGKETMQGLGEVVADSIVANVRASRQAGGGKIKENAPATKARKAAQRRKWRGGIRPLIDKQFRLIRAKGNSYKVSANDTQAVVGFATPEIGRIAMYVQKMGYVGWFGISKLAEREMRKRVHARVEQILQKAGTR